MPRELRITKTVALFCLICLAIPLGGQESRATIAGRVLDESQAVIAGAQVKATNVGTNTTAEATTSDAGVFRIPYLNPGTYRLTVEKQGFKTYLQDNIQLRVNDALDITAQMGIGSIAETIQVKAEPALLETADSSTGTVIDTRRIEELPLRGGNPLEFQRLSPGVVNLATTRIMKLASPDGTSQLSVNGAGNRSAQYNIDGFTDTTNDSGKGYARVAFIPPAGSITEFKIEGNPYDASAGHMLGPVVNVGTKSGSNDLHGSLYYWARNSAFDSANFFDNKAGIKKLAYQDHRYGVTFSGPVVLPRLYDGRNKTFFFFGWEENRFGQPSTSNQTSTVPTAAERTGDFSALLKLGSQYQIYNPYSTVAAGRGRLQRQPFANNMIPKSLLSPVGLNLINLYPLPNQAATSDGRNNYYYPDIRQQQYDSYLGRIDQNFGDRQRLFVRLNHFGYVVPKNLLGIPASAYISHQFNRGAAIDDVIVLNATTVLDLRYGVVAAEFPEARATQGIDLAGLGFGTALTSLLNPALATVPRVAASGFATLSDWSSGDGTNTSLTHQWGATLNKVQGSHSLHYGVDFRLLRTFGTRYPTSIAPDLTFANTYTRGPADNSTAAPLGQELAALLLGLPGGSMLNAPNPNYATQNSYLGVFFQDDYKVNARLSLNLGLRYEYEWPVTERYNSLVTGFAAGTANPIAAAAMAKYAANPIPEIAPSAFAVNGGLLFAGQQGYGRSPYAANSGAWLPRVGLAYQLTPNTVIRSGYGIYFGTIGVDTFLPLQTGFSQSTPIQTSLDNGLTYPTTLSNLFSNGLLPAQGAAGGLGTNLGQAIQFYDRNLKQPYSQRWSFGVQRILPWQTLLDVSYIGNRSTHLPVTQQINNTPAQYLSTLPVRDQPTINSLTQTLPSPFNGLNPVYSSAISRADLLRPYPEFGALSVQRSMGYSWYHSLQVRAEKRFSSGVSLLLGYTYSKYMQATEFLNPTDALPYRVISDMDRLQVFSISGFWELPFGKGRRFGSNMPQALNFVLGQWQFQGTGIRQSGPALAFSNPLFTGDIKDIPLPKGQRSPDGWFNVNAGFNRNSAQQLSNNLITFPLRLSGVRGDGQASWNFSLIRDYRIRERVTAQFRAESYNALNHPSFDVPNTSPINSSFGRVTATVSEPRNWQFALKVTF